MQHKHIFAAAGLSLVCLASPAWAQTSVGPSSASPGTSSDSMGAGTGLSMGGNMSPELRSRVENHMRNMQDLRARSAMATTPEQRQALMNEHMRLMDENMSLMQLMMGSGGGQGPGYGPGMGMPGATVPGGTPSSGSGSGSTPGTTSPGSPGSVR